ncbi:hypothetical protein DICVIV_02225 [Dictyocaulus viviparus]|uniref:Uncharacterized protein n=1 Tax=Dictyocaulus viviparus TaxID=29172 RepID=A0A0D8Y5W6_DICVI|nr:hypothetical protein DICVIV_02225 [Dictyocaulus viviparus]
MKWFYIFLTYGFIHSTHGEQKPDKPLEKSADKAKVDTIIDVLPFLFQRNFTTSPIISGSVWICFTRNLNETVNGILPIDVNEHCKDSLRVHAREQTVYVVKDNKFEAHPHYSPLVEFISLPSSDAQDVYGFKPYIDFDLEDIKDAKKGSEIRFYLAGTKILLLSSSPYCYPIFQQPFLGLLDGHAVNFSPLNVDDFMKTGSDQNDKPAHYFLAGSKGLKARVEFWQKNPSILFDPPSKRTNLRQAVFDCCPPTWEFEFFVVSSEWNVLPQITYQTYTLHKRQSDECKDSSSATTKFQSILLEIGEKCEWIRLCFDRTSKFCDNDANALSFIFVHDVYVPTDSDEVRQIGISFDKLDTIRINFLIGAKGIEIGYAFSSSMVPGITDLMYLDSYNGVDPSDLNINVVKAPNCQARLLNDMSTVNIRDALEAKLQCLSLSSCTCYE